MPNIGRQSVVLIGHDVFDGKPSMSGIEANVSCLVHDVLSVLKHLGARGYRFVAVQEFIRRSRDEKLVLLTFDDAYASVYNVLWPHLKMLGIATTIFVVGETIREGIDPFPLWQMALRDRYCVLRREQEIEIEHHPFIRRVVAAAGARNLSALLATPQHSVYRAFFETLEYEQLNELARVLLTICPELRQTMSLAQIHEMRASGFVEFGAHSMTHRSSHVLSAKDTEREIVESGEVVLELERDKTIADLAYAYPFGAVSSAALRFARKNYCAAFTTRSRPVTILDSRWALPRINLDRYASGNLGTPSLATLIRSLALDAAITHVRYGPVWPLVRPIHKLARLH